MPAHLRISRPATDLPAIVAMYKNGLDLEELGSFADHDGFDGVMIGNKGGGFHFEFTFCRQHPVTPSPTQEDLLVFYEPDPEKWAERCRAMTAAGFKTADPLNPYWAVNGRTFEDPDGYRVVIQQANWSNG
jgi:catechol 2,3-dioxygenase-like lactoylglutathione lyase family enzyme